MAKVQWCNTYELPEFVDPLSVDSCKRFVRSHRNLMSKSTRYFLMSSFPIAFKEVSTSPSGKLRDYWLWIIRPGFYTVVEFDAKPSQSDIYRVINGDDNQERSGEQ